MKFRYLLILLIIVVSCDKRNDDHTASRFHIDKNYYEIIQWRDQTINITSGSGDLQISTPNADKIQLSYEKGSTESGINGKIDIKGIKRGEAQVQLVDRVTKESVQLNLKIVPPYIELIAEDSTDPVLNIGTDLFLINDEGHSFYIFSYNHPIAKYNIPPCYSGYYQFVKEEDNVILRLKNKDDSFHREFVLQTNSKDDMDKLLEFSDSEIGEEYNLGIPIQLRDVRQGYTINGGVGMGTNIPEHFL